MAIENSFRIEFGPLTFERLGRPESYEILLGVQAELSIWLGGGEWFRQPMFPVLELAIAASRWLKQRGQLQFKTTEAEESPLLSISVTAGGCILASPWQNFEFSEMLPLDEVRTALSRFVNKLVEAAQAELRLDLTPVVE